MAINREKPVLKILQDACQTQVLHSHRLVHMHTHIYIYVYVYVYMYVHIYKCVCIYIYTGR